jgi:gliding motility-associated protein GldM
MSGGKQTPREKMVGMMYLVLTALLALNVSLTVIDKFVFINESLVRANMESKGRNLQILNSIVKTVDDTGNREKDVLVADASKKLRAQTQVVLDSLDALKVRMVDMTGGYMEHEAEYPGDAKHLEGKVDYSKVGHYMLPIEEGGQGEGEVLKETLNTYAEAVQDILKEFGAKDNELEHFRPIAVDADDDPVYNKDPNQKGKLFAALSFEESPTPACLATVSEFQARVLSYETRAMDYLSSKVGAGDISFDKIVAMVKPESKYVAAGTSYRAELFIAASASGVTPTMTYNGKNIQVEGGVGKVEFIASASSYTNNQSRQTYEAKITVPLPGGGDTTYASVEEYFVLKPTIQIQSKSVSALYLNCGNALDVQVPALGSTYNPSFSVTGGRHFMGQAIGQVTIVPNAREVVLTVSSNNNRIGSRSFGVRPIPAVEIKAYTGQGVVDIVKGMPAKTPRLTIRAIPDPGFAEFLPEDANFQVSQVVATLVSGGVGRQNVKGGQRLNLAAIASSARKGDVLVLEFKQVQRQNFRGDVEDFRAYNRSLIIPLK